MTDDLISRKSAIDALIAEGRNVDSHYLESERIIHESDAVEVISLLPSAQRKGRIIIRSNMLDGEDCYCSECDHWALLPDYKFCPYCGVAFEDVISERETMEEFMYGQDMGNPEDGSL